MITETTNDYDGAGRVIRSVVWDWTRPIVPQSTAVTEFSYDSLGRRTRMVDPNSGAWSYVFDNAGNLIFQDDPKADQHIAFCYDALGRVSRKLRRAGAAPTTASTTHCDGTPSGSVTTYAYGTDAATFERGRLKEVVDAYPEESAHLRRRFFYDRRGRITREERQIDVTVAAMPYSRTGNIRFGYDAADRVINQFYPVTNGEEVFTVAYDRYGMPAGVNGAAQTYAYGPVYDRFGHLTSWTDGSGLLHTAAYDGRRHALSGLRVHNPQVAGSLMKLDYTGYDPAGNLLAIDDTVSAPALSHDWQYQYDGLARLVGATGWGGTTTFAYDGLGNMTRGNGLDFDQLDPLDVDWSGDDDPLTIDPGVAPHQTRRIRAAGSGVWLGQVHDGNGALVQAQTPQLSLAVEYDREGRVKEVEAAGSTVRSIYDFSGARVARIIDEGLPTQRLTLYFGDWFEVSGSTLTRNISFAGRRVAVSPVGAPSSLTLARADTDETWLASLGWDGTGLFPTTTSPTIVAGAITATGASLLLLTIVATRRRSQPSVSDREPSALSLQPSASRGRRRRPVAAITLLAFSATQVPYLPRAEASSGPPSTPPPKPAFFIHTDHLGSTLLLTCFGQGATLGCADRTVYRQYRYDAYGRTKVYNAAGTQLTPGPQPTERLYTGQVWDWNANVHHYVARVYVPDLARFTSTDPVREYANPYAYVKWAPTALIDPTGMMGASAVPCLPAAEIQSRDFELLRDRLEPGNGGYTGPHGAGWNGIRPGEFSQSAAAAGESSPSSVDPSGRALSDLETLFVLLQMINPYARALGVAGKIKAAVQSAGSNRVGAFSRLAPGGGLLAHQTAGGHLLARHVGQTEAQLAARLAGSPQLSAASSFATRAEAEAAVAGAFDHGAAKVANWTAGGANGRLVLNAPFSGGIVLQRGASAAAPGTGVRVILQGNGSGSYYILTGFPTP